MKKRVWWVACVHLNVNALLSECARFHFYIYLNNIERVIKGTKVIEARQWNTDRQTDEWTDKWTDSHDKNYIYPIQRISFIT